MDESLFYGRSQNYETENREKTVKQHLRGTSDDMNGKNRSGTWETLADPDLPAKGKGREGKEPSYKETKEKEVSRAAEGVVVPKKFWKQDRGKGF